MRCLAFSMIALSFSLAAGAQEPCSAENALIDERLAHPGYTAEQREQGEQLKELLTVICSTGGAQAGAMVAAQLDMILPPPSGAATVATALTKDDLTNEYLNGQWCREGQEATSYDFAADGSYRYAVVGWNVGADGHHYFDEILPKSDFLELFDYLMRKEQDQFVTLVGRRGRGSELVFSRGACAFVSVGGAG